MSKRRPTSILGQPAFTTTEISKKLGIGISASFIENTLGVPPDEVTSISSMWLEKSFFRICYELSQHAHGVGYEQMERL